MSGAREAPGAALKLSARFRPPPPGRLGAARLEPGPVNDPRAQRQRQEEIQPLHQQGSEAGDARQPNKWTSLVPRTLLISRRSVQPSIVTAVSILVRAKPVARAA